MEAAELTTVGVALHIDGHRVEVHRRQEDQACASAEDWQTCEDVFADRLEQTELAEELGLGG